MLKKHVIVIFSVAAFIAIVSEAQEPHVFWYKALLSGYALAENNPGPGIPSDAIVHEGMIVSATYSNGHGYDLPHFVVGSATGDWQAWSAAIWSKDLNDSAMTGRVDSAFAVGEVRDGWTEDSYNNTGPIHIKCGVVDVSFGISMWGRNEIPENTEWKDISFGTLNYTLPTIPGTDTMLSVDGLNGRLSVNMPSSLDGQFLRLTITKQVNYILANSGEFAIVFLVPSNQGSTGKFNLYADEDRNFTYEKTLINVNGSDNPWTEDGNTVHVVAYGDLTNGVAVQKKVPGANEDIHLNIAPNPFNPSTTISLENVRKGGNIRNVIFRIYDIKGMCVHAFDTPLSKVADGFLWKAANLPGGVYVICTHVGNKTLSKRVFLQK
ncbi:MAG: hypothetical protein A2268_05565 [Candidatus Raymondbacteria bacterium RifOxyA12_full_50_37]|uniref:Secretion system C-terminal sorting domain-containing protein n=1 Tax=Candidatus Raymondbacteria bacterium RIFOXYD12_FULL_49_13 TaxID=1817890 RepID=A0A1F7FBJ7_UNCRA|nr:MAG: hypothetical protein A2268_05565 [Candidatus Raymondbacteria bacterium RifOxyA12_full_50_37]OGJ89032.1 MAG: hypothetical protein A2248_02800 [Candidatus Raymondbacteria bacterium RIFOXYA2_FULL_49_16]OGJ93795.1 MAG: hypothetical protein A2350_06540 [Candidatus Raymondbacteria bacterium RifOxyB12_full_50_8]OGJ97059.1 MAG: hypothetical protein A2453_04215 [Candidatus Raymondbacteria bacterium RIFOXYC2_FULL_50_21]OGK02744.1 MAG: hypothetical protein A2487_01060 [Candidatus Raymondbacteria b